MISNDLDHREHNSDVADRLKTDVTSNISMQQSFLLLEERLRIELTQRKIGEIVIRKEIETQLVSIQVPVQREKPIVEQVSPVYKLLAEIDLAQPINSNGAIDPISANSNKESSPIEFDALPENIDRQTTRSIVHGSTDSLQAASELLNAIASLPRHEFGTIRIEIDIKNSEHQTIYQALVDRYCHRT